MIIGNQTARRTVNYTKSPSDSINQIS